jgi:prepilin-type processing-associated H-X9-DG protein
MNRRNRARSPFAFTLIELLVVVGIIAVLIALLMPALTRARESAKTIACASHMAQLGQAVLVFATQNEGRGPGLGEMLPVSTTSHTFWPDILNIEVFGRKAGTGPFQYFNYTKDKSGNVILGPGPGMMTCPNTGGEGLYVRPYAMNTFVLGGYQFNPPYAPENGVPTAAGKMSTSSKAGNEWYYLGAQLTRFSKPSVTYMAIEGGHADDKLFYKSTVHPEDATPESPYSSGTDWFAFRHPNLTANFLFIDGHVETMNCKDKTVNQSRRFSYTGI